MELIIFKKNELPVDIFKNLVPFKYIEYSNLSELKNKDYGDFYKLDITKSKIDLLDKNSEKFRRAAAKYLHEYELIKLICKKQVISRAYFKLYEILYNEPIILYNNLDCFFICEAPGGFIECVTDIRRKKLLRTNYLSVSKNNDIKYDRYLDDSKLLYADLLNINDIENTINKTLLKFPNKLDLITADGGFDIKLFNGQEIISQKLILSEIYIALSTQKIGGMFVIKFFDMFTHNSIVFYFILCSLYNYVKIIKPCSSRNCNSERYLVCYDFNGAPEFIINDIYKTLKNFVFSDSHSETLGVSTIMYPNFDINKFQVFSKKINMFNNLILYEQIKTINESIKMVNSKDTYFQNLILNLFIEKIPINYIFFYKNILNSRIKKCINFLRNYNINTNHFIYRFE
jgi:23S rRNA U2552 (ribose-2'-O)-methylase RlmE/FtsJ